MDLGAQFFHPDTHPIYVTLLEELGLYDPEQPDLDATVRAPASLCIFRTGGGAPVFSSSHALETPERAIEFAKFTQLARQAVLSDLPWEITVEAWIRGLPLRASFKQDILYPWIAALIGCARDEARRASARSILQTFALSFPADLLEPATTYTSKLGLQGNLRRMLRRSPTARVHVGSPVRALSRTRAGWFLRTPGGRKGPYRYVVLNAPPRAGRELLRPLPVFADATALLDEYRYFDSRLLIHTDPAYMPRDRGDWAAYNAGVRGSECEGSAWIGALQEEPPRARASTSSSRGPRAGAPTQAHPPGAGVQVPADQPLDDRRRARPAPAPGPARPVLQRPLHHRHGPAGVGDLLGHEGRRGSRAPEPSGIAKAPRRARTPGYLRPPLIPTYSGSDRLPELDAVALRANLQSWAKRPLG